MRKNFFTVDEIIYNQAKRFSTRVFENKYFDFGNQVIEGRIPEVEDLRKIILGAMDQAGIKGGRLSEENAQIIDLYFSQFLGSGKKKPRRESKAGNLILVRTKDMDKTSIRASELDKDAVVFMSADYEEELGKANLFVLDYIKTLRGKFREEQLELFEEMDPFLIKNRDKIWPFAGYKSPYIVNTSIFKTPQSIVKVSSTPEKLFVYGLLENAKYIDAWIKSRDMGFYSIEYEYFRKGKDRVRGSFNPDFFIKIDLDRYIKVLREEGIESKSLRRLQDKGIDTIIRVVEVKSEEDDDESTPAKQKYAEEHFWIVNKKLLEGGNLPAEIFSEQDNHANHLYIFDLLIPPQFDFWFQNLRTGQDRLYSVLLEEN